MTDVDDWGCEYCRNDGKLSDIGVCPKCDAQYTDETEERPNPMTDILELAKRVEALDGPDREVNRAIAKLMGWHRVEPRHTRNKHGAWIAPEDWIGRDGSGAPILDSLHGTTMHRDVPAYTASLDDAMTLVPEGHSWMLSVGGVAIAQVTDCTGDARAVPPDYEGKAATPTLALVAAALRAKDATNG